MTLKATGLKSEAVPMSTYHDSLTIHLVRGVAVATAMLMVTILTIGRSQAAFTATTDNAANQFSTGTVVLTDDDGGAAMFTATNISPGTPVVECIAVTYSGSQLPAPVRLYGTSTGTLDTFLDTTIEMGTGGSFGDCIGFAPTSTVYTGTLADFSTNNVDWASGLTTFTAAANPTTQIFRFTVDVQDNPAAQANSSTATFIFETQA